MIADALLAGCQVVLIFAAVTVILFAITHK